MAVLNVLVDRDPALVWEVLSDGWAYADWVAGTRRVKDVDPRWPGRDSQIRYVLGAGPFTLEDVTTVRLVEPPHRLELEAHAGKLGSARISISLLPWGGDRTVVVLDEHPLTGPGGWWHTAAVDAALRFRNQRMVRRLAETVQARHPR